MAIFFGIAAVVPGNLLEADPILRGQIFLPRRILRKEHRATLNSLEGSQHWRTSYGMSYYTRVFEVRPGSLIEVI
jgi:hypothetical protein